MCVYLLLRQGTRSVYTCEQMRLSVSVLYVCVSLSMGVLELWCVWPVCAHVHDHIITVSLKPYVRKIYTACLMRWLVCNVAYEQTTERIRCACARTHIRARKDRCSRTQAHHASTQRVAQTLVGARKFHEPGFHDLSGPVCKSFTETSTLRKKHRHVCAIYVLCVYIYIYIYK